MLCRFVAHLIYSANWCPYVVLMRWLLEGVFGTLRSCLCESMKSLVVHVHICHLGLTECALRMDLHLGI